MEAIAQIQSVINPHAYMYTMLMFDGIWNDCQSLRNSSSGTFQIGFQLTVGVKSKTFRVSQDPFLAENARFSQDQVTAAFCSFLLANRHLYMIALPKWTLCKEIGSLI